MKSDELAIEVVCRNLPGICFADTHSSETQTYESVYLGIQRGAEVIEAVPANQRQAMFRPTFKIGQPANGSPNFLGPFAKGTPQERFFYLSWGVMDKHGHFQMFRRANAR